MRGTFALFALLVGLAGGPSPAGASPPAAAPPAKAEVALKQDHGALLVPVMINDAVRLDFTLDSGAAMVSIPADVAMTLMMGPRVFDLPAAVGLQAGRQSRPEAQQPT